MALCSDSATDTILAYELGDSAQLIEHSRKVFQVNHPGKYFSCGRCVNFSVRPDGSLIAIARYQRPIELWSFPQFDLLGEVPQSSGNIGVSFLPFGSCITFSAFVAGHSLADTRSDISPVYNLDRGQLAGALPASDIAITTHPNGKVVALALNEPDSGEISFAPFNEATEVDARPLLVDLCVSGMVFSPDGTKLAVVKLLDRCALGLYSFPKLREICSLESGAYSLIFDQPLVPYAERVVFSCDSQRLFCSNLSGDLVVLDANTGSQLSSCPAHHGPIVSMDTLNDGKFLVTSGEDSKLLLWSLE